MLPENEVRRLAAMSVWEQLHHLISSGRITIDRPRGHAHPKFGEYIYPVDYGYLHDSDGGDSEGIDVWMGSAFGRGVAAVFCTVDVLQRNAEVKVAWNCSDAEIDLIEAFYATQPQAAIAVRRGATT